ncbi:hypothetical protein AC629_16900 [Bradyrhizobium sp. NAS80.1]|nr:hypothetical protein AC629_16900 [Bradyrhizobium sp. NAS80.1]
MDPIDNKVWQVRSSLLFAGVLDFQKGFNAWQLRTAFQNCEDCWKGGFITSQNQPRRIVGNAKLALRSSKLRVHADLCLFGPGSKRSVAMSDEVNLQASVRSIEAPDGIGASLRLCAARHGHEDLDPLSRSVGFEGSQAFAGYHNPAHSWSEVDHLRHLDGSQKAIFAEIVRQFCSRCDCIIKRPRAKRFVVAV